MLARDDPALERQEIPAGETQLRSWRTIRPRRPSSVWGWLLWLLVALLFYLLISYVVRWWYKPVPTDLPPATPNSNTRST